MPSGVPSTSRGMPRSGGLPLPACDLPVHCGFLRCPVSLRAGCRLPYESPQSYIRLARNCPTNIAGEPGVLVVGVEIVLHCRSENTQVIDSAYYQTAKIAQNNRVLADIWPMGVATSARTGALTFPFDRGCFRSRRPRRRTERIG